MVRVGGRDDGDDDVTKNTYENADDAMRIGAKEENVGRPRLHRRRKAFEKKKKN